MDSQENTTRPRLVARAADYEACSPDALPSGQMAFLRAIHETFLRSFAEDLSARLDTPVSAQIIAVRPLSRGVFLEACAQGGCLIELEASPGPGRALAEFSPVLVAYLLQTLLGGPPGAGSHPAAVTEIEHYLLREIFELHASQLTAAWASTGIAFRWPPAGGQEGFAERGSMLVFESALKLDAVEADFRIAVPAFLARIAAIGAAPAAPALTPAPVRKMILDSLRSATVRVEAVLTSSTLRMADLLEMEAGQVLMLPQPAGSPVECRIGGKPKFQGELVDHGARRVLLLL